MKRKFYTLVLTFLCLFFGQLSFGQGIGELGEVIVYGWCHPLNSDYDHCTCHPEDCVSDSGECTDITSSTWPCAAGAGYLDTGDCNDERSYAFPCNQDDSQYWCELYGIGCDDIPIDATDDPCDITSCPDPAYELINCECVKKVYDDCKKSKKNTELPSNKDTHQKGDIVTFNGPFYFSDTINIPTNFFNKDGSIGKADLVPGYSIIKHGNYIEIPSISYKYNQFSSGFHGGKLGGFEGKDCPDVAPDPTDPNPTDPNFDATDYGNTGAFDSHDPCDPGSSAFDICVCDPTYCINNGSPTQEPPCTQPCTANQRTKLGKIVRDLCPCADNPKKLWYIDKDGDGFDSGTKYIDIFFANPGKQYKLATLGPDCDDNKKNVQFINSCGVCAVEPANGKCPCKTSAADLKLMFPGLTDAKASQLADVLNKHAWKFGIDTKEKLQHFLAQAGHESKNFTKTEENTNYRVSVAKGIFDDLFKANGKNINDFGSYLNSKGIAFIDDKEAFFNFVYDDAVRGNAKGWSKNGNTNPGDGYLYIGRGIIQLTGREKYTNFTNWYQKNINSNNNFINNPTLLDTDFEVGVLASLWFFKTFVTDKLNIDAQTTSEQVTIRVNPKMVNHKERNTNFNNAQTTINCN